MPKLYFTNYTDAANAAKKTADLTQESIKLGRSDYGFFIDIPESSQDRAPEDIFFDSDTFDWAPPATKMEELNKLYEQSLGIFPTASVLHNHEEDLYEVYDSNDYHAEVFNELMDYSESLSRSDEGGWFYEDG